ncbi:glycosyltransferase family 4 protein [Streptococcus loxodontisalivarius]|uniref:1,2-diacylglycerol 3-alpha-glucosyltransferase n=1 Tax=Streptococcus loxodontisalivarius TaxID=1349415 RepID=A0ABS2PQM0_9STRE|nr:glycosyltransferase family 4 protein [Streptococcus loxodontisalivarius]MBM7642343.1 1,2-diacylglycerol 3-alpha-glucosyltransferase [Streptococcus loxodontisalivarius]
MKIGFFTDTYFPQVSGVATSIRTLKEELEKAGHDVYIFTATEKNIKVDDDPTIVRLPSVPFIAFTDRRMVYSGLNTAYQIAKEHDLDIIHTHTEFVMGSFGYMIARELGIPIVHTYHTHYEDYVHYIAKGRLIKPSMVKYFVKDYLRNYDAVICPSRIVQNILDGYDVAIQKRIIPTGIELDQYLRPDLTDEDVKELRSQLGIADADTMLLSLSRISYEKNIQAVLKSLPAVLENQPQLKLVVVGDGPYRPDLEELTKELGIQDAVIFTGMVAQTETALYYKAADFFISASTSETQGLTYTESLASGTPVIAHGNPYLDDLIDDVMFGTLYYDENNLSQAIIEAIQSTPQMDQAKLDEKLYSISADHFGKSVYELYLDLIISKEYKVERSPFSRDGKRKYTHIKVVRRTMSAPSRVVRGTAKTTARMVKTPKSLIDSLRDFFD